MPVCAPSWMAENISGWARLCAGLSRASLVGYCWPFGVGTAIVLIGRQLQCNRSPRIHQSIDWFAGRIGGLRMAARGIQDKWAWKPTRKKLPADARPWPECGLGVIGSAGLQLA